MPVECISNFQFGLKTSYLTPQFTDDKKTFLFELYPPPPPYCAMWRGSAETRT
jgi:hypothetical protein